MRPVKTRFVEAVLATRYYKPQGLPMKELLEITLPIEGLEAMRLADYLGKNQTQAAAQMGVSKATFCRILGAARKTIATALIKGYALRIEGGNYALLTDIDSTTADSSLPRAQCRK